MAGTVTITSRDRTEFGIGTRSRTCEIVTIAVTADAADGSVPNTSIPLKGFLVKAITNPGATAPTDNYDIELMDPADVALDALGGALTNRDTATTEQAYPVITGAACPVFLCGTYTLKVSNNSVNSATVSIILYLLDE